MLPVTVTPAATFHTLSPRDPAALQSACEIYRAAIPAPEQKTLDQLRAMLARPDYRFIVARDPSDAITALAILFTAADVSLLEYLAVSPAHRSHGLGSSLFRHCASTLPNPLLIEIDSPAPPGPDQPLRARRVSFYRRLGCRQLAGLAYRLPLPGDPPPMGLFLHTPAPPDSLPLPTLRRYLTTLYTQVYGQRPDDPRLSTMLANLPDPVPLI